MAERGAGLRADAARNRERLVAAAREVFAADGLGASLEEIARRAGVRVGTLYHRFEGREALVDAALIGRVEEAVDHAERALAEPDPWHGLVDHLTALAAWQAADRGFTDVCVAALPAGCAVEDAKRRGHALTERLVARAHDADVLRADVGLADLGLLLWAVVRATDGVRETHPDAWRRHLAVLLDGLRADAAHPLPGTPLDDSAVQAAMALPRGRRSGTTGT